MLHRINTNSGHAHVHIRHNSKSRERDIKERLEIMLVEVRIIVFESKREPKERTRVSLIRF